MHRHCPEEFMQSFEGSTVILNPFSMSPCRPCLNNRCDFQLLGSMTSKRWYPTAQLLPDGRVIIVGGANTFGNIVINMIATNNPTYEFWPRAPGEGESIRK